MKRSSRSISMESQQIFPRLWKNLRSPSVEEEDILEVLLLMEGSIWEIFEYDPESAKQAASLHKSKQRNADKPLQTDDSSARASLRDAIDVLLQTSPKPGEYHDDWRSMVRLDEEEIIETERLGNDINDDDIALSQVLLDLSDLLDTAAELEDESDESSSADIIAIAATMLDQNRTRVSRDLEVLAKRTGNNHVLEVPGYPGSAQNDLVGAEAAAENNNWNDVDGLIYDRVPNYQDSIPDVLSQIFQHNGHRSVKYSLELEHSLRQASMNDPDEFFD